MAKSSNISPQSPKSNNELKNQVVAAGGTAGLGAILGFCSGMFVKKVGRVAAIAVGALVCLFQVAAHFEYVTINWSKVERDLTRILDVNHDGKLDEKDINYGLEKTVKILSKNAPSGGAGFAGGFFLGFKKG